MRALVLAQVFTTLPLVGLIWTIQLIHYPLFGRVGTDRFPDYHRAHSTRISWLVIPLMLIELAAALVMLFAPPPLPNGRLLSGIGFGLVLVVWLSTFLFQVPQHRILREGFSQPAWQTLVRSNWLRTWAWTARGGLLLYLLNASPTASSF